MLFPTTVFAVFYLIVYLGHRRLVQRSAIWKWFILTASYVFYGYWDWRFAGLIALSSIVNHALGVTMHRTIHESRRRLWLIFAVVFNLGLLGFFKYYGFFSIQLYVLLSRVGLAWSPPLLDIILPVGISFFTFQAMSYVIDIYRRELEPTRTVLDFALYLAFFPQLVAGPIVRAKVFLPQLDHIGRVDRIDAGRGAVLILTGLFKKIVIANYLSAHIVDPVFSQPEAYGRLDNLFAVYGYAIQIYCDFSAYSDIAIGIALLMGFHFPLNFNAPYFAGSIQDFWRRWHISLSTWLRDYLYIPLGGSRHGSFLTYRNLFLTFLLGGLWHGAAWTFVAWGALHGAYLMVERMGRKLINPSPSLFWRGVRLVAVFHLVCLSWVFFRAETFEDAWYMLRQIAMDATPSEWITPTLLLALAVGWCTQFLDGDRLRKAWDRAGTWPAWAQGLAAAIVLTVILALGPKGVSPFIYFQF